MALSASSSIWSGRYGRLCRQTNSVAHSLGRKKTTFLDMGRMGFDSPFRPILYFFERV